LVVVHGETAAAACSDDTSPGFSVEELVHKSVAFETPALKTVELVFSAFKSSAFEVAELEGADFE
jgi:hypothetical protein